MTQVENNVLIAEFIGRRGKDKPYLLWFYDKISGKGWHKEDELHFHDSWDWLMYVVEYIEEIVILEKKVEVSIYNNRCQITSWSENSLIYIIASNKFNAVYIAVTKFILWYTREQTLNFVKNRYLR